MKLGSLFSGIGGLELGLERAIPGLQTIWQVEENQFCQKVLNQHWPNATIYDDVETVGAHNLKAVDIICGGFPCQDISCAGKGEGINAERSGLWWEFHRIIDELQPRVAVLENVPAITFRGLSAVTGSLTSIGYDCEWQVISARQFGAPHLRERWFAVAYPSECRERLQSIAENDRSKGFTHSNQERRCAGRNTERKHSDHFQFAGNSTKNIQSGSGGISQSGSTRTIADPGKERRKEYPIIKEQTEWESPGLPKYCNRKENERAGNHWREFPTQSPVCRRDDGIPNRVDRIKALGNAVVPQCSQWIGERILKSGLLDDLD